MKTVRRLLNQRSGTIWTVPPDAAISETMALMAAKDIGALLVTEDDRLVGIVTERDVARRLAKGDSPQLAVKEIMTSRVLYVLPDNTIEECMALMTEKHVRHLPVLDNDRLLGMISIRDVVADMIAEKSFLIEQLEHYIYAIPPYGRSSTPV